MPDDIVENLSRPEQWLRVLFMVVLVIGLYVVGLMLTLVTAGQVLFSLLTGSDNDNLRALGKSLTLYVKQILDFLTYNSEIKPFPFSPYPHSNATSDSAHAEGEGGGDDTDVEVWVSDSASAEVDSGASSAPRKRSVRRKSAAAKPDPDVEEA